MYNVCDCVVFKSNYSLNAVCKVQPLNVFRSQGRALLVLLLKKNNIKAKKLNFVPGIPKVQSVQDPSVRTTAVTGLFCLIGAYNVFLLVVGPGSTLHYGVNCSDIFIMFCR